MIKGQDIFNYIDSRANYIFKDSKGIICWSSNEPKLDEHCWDIIHLGIPTASGNLGILDIEEFKDKKWQECVIKKEVKEIILDEICNNIEYCVDQLTQYNEISSGVKSYLRDIVKKNLESLKNKYSVLDIEEVEIKNDC